MLNHLSFEISVAVVTSRSYCTSLANTVDLQKEKEGKRTRMEELLILYSCFFPRQYDFYFPSHS